MTDAGRIRQSRTLLFVPGIRPDRFERALATSADVVVVDLEASVRPVDKDEARRAMRTWLSSCPGFNRVAVRVNPITSAAFVEDLAAIRATRCAGIVLAMTERADHVADAIAAAPQGLSVIALIETAAGVLEAPAIARVPGVVRLAFGNMDYATDTGTRGRDSTIFPAAQLVVASRAARLPPPIAGVTAAFRDAGLLAQEATWERDQGFGAKFCIHPEQIDVVARVFSLPRKKWRGRSVCSPRRKTRSPARWTASWWIARSSSAPAASSVKQTACSKVPSASSAEHWRPRTACPILRLCAPKPILIAVDGPTPGFGGQAKSIA